MWIRTLLCAVGADGPTSPLTRAISRTDTSMGKKLVQSCCTVSQLKVSQKKELQLEKFWPHVFPSMAHKMENENCGFD